MTTIENAVQVLQQNNLKVTKQRRCLLEILIKNPDKYVDITRVDNQMRMNFPGMSHSTIYRNLREFGTVGLVEMHQRGDQMEVKFQCDLSNRHHHHFVCEQCGRVIEIQMSPLDMAFFYQQLPGVTITGHQFELYGICSRCRAQVDAK